MAEEKRGDRWKRYVRKLFFSVGKLVVKVVGPRNITTGRRKSYWQFTGGEEGDR